MHALAAAIKFLLVTKVVVPEIEMVQNRPYNPSVVSSHVGRCELATVYVRACVLYIRQEADLAAAALTVTAQRLRVVDFTYPFIGSIHLAALVKRRHATQAAVSSLRDLARQSMIDYGAVDAGSTKERVRTSKDPDHVAMWAAMAANVDGFVSSTEEGVGRVVGSSDRRPWALIGVSPTLEYYAGRRCDLEVLVDPFTVFGGLAMAVPLGSPYLDRINLAVVEMIDSGEMSSLFRKWWASTDDCRHVAATNDATRLVSPLRHLLQAFGFKLHSSVKFGFP